MTATAVIGGVERHLGAWKPSRLRMSALRPAGLDLAALPMQHEIKGFPTGYDQQRLGSCGPNSIAEIFEFYRGQRYSRLFLYFFTRMFEHDVALDAGVEIPDLFTVAQSMGMPLETTWPYEISWFEVPPSVTSIIEAQKTRVKLWELVADLDHLLLEIARDQPVTFGFRVPSSMQSDECARSGMVNVPSATDPVIGGHCCNFIGYDRVKRLLRATCHYGPGFGDRGTILLPFEHVTSGNASDMSVIRSIS